MRYKILAVDLGFSCFIVQLVLLREFMSLFSGNELIIGIMLSLWMLFSALGAWIGKFTSEAPADNKKLFLLTMLLGLMPLAGIFIAAWLKTIAFAPGELAGLQGIILVCAAGLVLFCISSGMMFSILASIYASVARKDSISKIYALEAAGGLAGGALFNFLLVFVLDSIQILSIVAMINIFLALWMAFRAKWKWLALACLMAALGFLTAINIYDLDQMLVRMIHPGQNILITENSPYGRITISEQHGQYTIFQNGQALISSEDAMEREEKVHYPLSLHPAPKRVLMLFGGMDGAAIEVMKYDDVTLTYVDPEYPWMKKAEKFFSTGLDKRVNIFVDDPRKYLAGTKETYDIIMVNAAMPVTVANNRYYTGEFFTMARKRLTNNGILSLRLPSSGNYLDEYTRLLYSSIFKTLKANFGHVRIVPGNLCYFLASDKPLEGDITRAIEDKQLSTIYVNHWYIDDISIDSRASVIRSELDEGVAVNSDRRPLAAYLSIMQWLALFHVPVWLLVLLPFVLMAIIMLQLAALNIGLFVSGFSASSAEFILLIAFQLAYGYIYQMAGLVIMSFMLGLALGAGYLHRFFTIGKSVYIRLQLIIGLFLLLLPFVLLPLTNGTYPKLIPAGIICTLTFIMAALTGIQYRMATLLIKGTGRQIASSTYGADLAGSAFGIFLVAVFLYPLAGMVYTCFILAVLNFLASLVIKWSMK
ncbi:MAG TPA: hypothetical protein VK994_01630 [Bacteroidales bacterium]|nr:hypothetical protein [Bacteroidales bacterium]